MIYKALDEYSKRDLNPHSHYWPKDFKSFVSTIPPFGLSGVDARENCGKFTT